MDPGGVRVHDATPAALFPYEGSAQGRPGWKGHLMDPVIVSALTALAGLAVRGIAIAALLVRLRWQERQQCAHGAYLTALAQALPRGCRLDEVRADGSELHLMIAHSDELTERPCR